MGERSFSVTCRAMLEPAAERALTSAGYLTNKGGPTTPGSRRHRYHLLEVPASNETDATQKVRTILEDAGATGFELEVGRTEA